MMKRYLWPAVLCLGLLWASEPTFAESPLEALHKKAKAEGEGVIWSPRQGKAQDRILVSRERVGLVQAKRAKVSQNTGNKEAYL